MNIEKTSIRFMVILCFAKKAFSYKQNIAWFFGTKKEREKERRATENQMKLKRRLVRSIRASKLEEETEWNTRNDAKKQKELLPANVVQQRRTKWTNGKESFLLLLFLPVFRYGTMNMDKRQRKLKMRTWNEKERYFTARHRHQNLKSE